MVNYRLVALVPALLLCFAFPLWARKTEHLKITPETTFTLVFGSEDAKLNQTDAEKYCQELGQKEMNITAPLKATGHLASLHDKRLIKNLMTWILKNEHHRVYIGGVVTKVVRHESVFYKLRWLDGTPDDFRFLHLPNRQLHEMKHEEERCLAIDYITGRWGVHECTEKLFFLCEVHVNDPEAMKPELPVEQIESSQRRTPLIAREEFPEIPEHRPFFPRPRF